MILDLEEVGRPETLQQAAEGWTGLQKLLKCMKASNFKYAANNFFRMRHSLSCKKSSKSPTSSLAASEALFVSNRSDMRSSSQLLWCSTSASFLNYQDCILFYSKIQHPDQDRVDGESAAWGPRAKIVSRSPQDSCSRPF